MTAEQFAKIIMELSHYYERKPPSNESMDLWYQRVKDLPAEPIIWILEQIKDHNEYFPKNITSLMWSLYHQWLMSQPEKYAQAPQYECPRCDQGLLYAVKQEHNREYRYMFRCGHCRQVDVEGWPMATEAELQEKGYVLLPEYRRANRPVR